MDILVTYEDGTTELRDDKSPLLVRRRMVGHQWASPSVEDVIDVRPYFSDGWGMWLVTAEDRLLDACAATVELSARRGDRGWAWRITGGRAKGELLTGEWCACKVESVAEQIERLTRERDAALAQAAALAATVDPTKAVGWAAKVTRLTEERDAEKARANAAEKRLAGLRAWAKDQNNWDGFHVPDVIAEILDRTEEAP